VIFGPERLLDLTAFARAWGRYLVPLPFVPTLVARRGLDTPPEPSARLTYAVAESGATLVPYGPAAGSVLTMDGLVGSAALPESLGVDDWAASAPVTLLPASVGPASAAVRREGAVLAAAEVVGAAADRDRRGRAGMTVATATSDEPAVAFERDGDSGVAVIGITRPGKRNALRLIEWDRIGELIRQCAQDSSVRAVVITGHGGAFSAGFDLHWNESNRSGSGLPVVLRTVLDTYRCPKPVLAAVEGCCRPMTRYARPDPPSWQISADVHRADSPLYVARRSLTRQAITGQDTGRTEHRLVHARCARRHPDDEPHPAPDGATDIAAALRHHARRPDRPMRTLMKC